MLLFPAFVNHQLEKPLNSLKCLNAWKSLDVLDSSSHYLKMSILQTCLSFEIVCFMADVGRQTCGIIVICHYMIICIL